MGDVAAKKFSDSPECRDNTQANARTQYCRCHVLSNVPGGGGGGCNCDSAERMFGPAASVDELLLLLLLGTAVDGALLPPLLLLLLELDDAAGCDIFAFFFFG